MTGTVGPPICSVEQPSSRADDAGCKKMALALAGIDLAKSLSPLHGADAGGRLVMNQRSTAPAEIGEAAAMQDRDRSLHRGLLLGRGVTTGVSIRPARLAIPETLADPGNGLPSMTREIIAELYELLGQIDMRIKTFDRRTEAVFRAIAACQPIALIWSAGPKQ